MVEGPKILARVLTEICDFHHPSCLFLERDIRRSRFFLRNSLEE